jgi:hypothetical protein|tara:strand:+ start:7564 stop:8112 length:549 start_codon:yes stop_codon:yes gene_type:complete
MLRYGRGMNDERAERLAAIDPKNLKSLIERMRATSDHSKAAFTLPELLAEQQRREKVGSFPTIETAQKIIELVAASESGVTTYLDIWDAFRPGQPWEAHKSRQEVTNALDRVNAYCIRHGLPLLVTLVVNKHRGKLTDDAKENIFNYAKERSVAVGEDRDAFILDQQERARALTLAALPVAD